jgi:hypothetical protein
MKWLDRRSEGSLRHCIGANRHRPDDRSIFSRLSRHRPLWGLAGNDRRYDIGERLATVTQVLRNHGWSYVVPDSPMGCCFGDGFYIRYSRAILISLGTVGCRPWRNHLTTSEGRAESTTRKIDCYANTVAACASWISRSRNLGAHLPSRQCVQVQYCEWPCHRRALVPTPESSIAA